MIIDPLGIFQFEANAAVGTADAQPAADTPDRFRLPVVEHAVKEVIAAELGIIPDPHVAAGIEVQTLNADGKGPLDGGRGGFSGGALPFMDPLPVVGASAVDPGLVLLAVHDDHVTGAAVIRLDLPVRVIADFSQNLAIIV